MAPEKPKRRTMYVPASQRNTSQVLLRMAPEVADRLRGLAVAWKTTMGEVVEAGLDALDRQGKR